MGAGKVMFNLVLWVGYVLLKAPVWKIQSGTSYVNGDYWGHEAGVPILMLLASHCAGPMQNLLRASVFPLRF